MSKLFSHQVGLLADIEIFFKCKITIKHVAAAWYKCKTAGILACNTLVDDLRAVKLFKTIDVLMYPVILRPNNCLNAEKRTIIIERAIALVTIEDDDELKYLTWKIKSCVWMYLCIFTCWLHEFLGTEARDKTVVPWQ